MAGETLIQWFGAYSPDTVVQVTGPTVQPSKSPYPVPLNQAVQVTVHATRNPGGRPVAGDVLVNGARVAATNTPFTDRFRMRLVGRTFDPEAGVWVPEMAPPDGRRAGGRLPGCPGRHGILIARRWAARTQPISRDPGRNGGAASLWGAWRYPYEK